MKKIIVGIPSFNEANCIVKTTKIVDRAITRYFHNFYSLIINVDNNSPDHTKDFFLNTKTKNKKVSLLTSLPGKGRNILKLLKYAFRKKADCVVTIDADISTLQEDWIKKLALPILKEEADIVTPLYLRNRFESSTTNHFAFPVLLGYFNYYIRQPIGGEFAFSKKFIKTVLNESIVESTLFYGIDIFLTITGIAYNFRFEQVFLGRKIHKPSFPKIDPMFEQVAFTTFNSLQKLIIF